MGFFNCDVRGLTDILVVISELFCEHLKDVYLGRFAPGSVSRLTKNMLIDQLKPTLHIPTDQV